MPRRTSKPRLFPSGLGDQLLANAERMYLRALSPEQLEAYMRLRQAVAAGRYADFKTMEQLSAHLQSLRRGNITLEADRIPLGEMATTQQRSCHD